MRILLLKIPLSLVLISFKGPFVIPLFLNPFTCGKSGSGWRSRCSDPTNPGWSRDRIPVGVKSFATIHTGPWANHAFYTMGNGSFSN